MKMDVETTRQSETAVTSVAMTIAVCFCVALLEGFDIQALGISLGKLTTEFGLDGSQRTLLTTFSSVGIVLGAIVGGRLADFLGRKPVLMGAVAGFGLFTLGMIAAPNFIDTVRVSRARGPRLRRCIADHDGDRRRDQHTRTQGFYGRGDVQRHAGGRRQLGTASAVPWRRFRLAVAVPDRRSAAVPYRAGDLLPAARDPRSEHGESRAAGRHRARAVQRRPVRADVYCCGRPFCRR